MLRACMGQKKNQSPLGTEPLPPPLCPSFWILSLALSSASTENVYLILLNSTQALLKYCNTTKTQGGSTKFPLVRTSIREFPYISKICHVSPRDKLSSWSTHLVSQKGGYHLSTNHVPISLTADNPICHSSWLETSCHLKSPNKQRELRQKC